MLYLFETNFAIFKCLVILSGTRMLSEWDTVDNGCKLLFRNCIAEIRKERQVFLKAKINRKQREGNSIPLVL